MVGTHIQTHTHTHTVAHTRTHSLTGKDDSLLMDINKQIESFAQTVRSDPELARGFNLIGHSQGGLIVRAYVERFNNPPVYNMISWAGPQAGVFGVPDFNSLCPDAVSASV